MRLLDLTTCLTIPPQKHLPLPPGGGSVSILLPSVLCAHPMLHGCAARSFGIPTIAFGVAIAAFIIGAVARLYVRIPAEGSPFTRIFRVLRGE